MPTGTLADLVTGYTQAQDQKIKKAREAADKASEQWTRQFKLDQAKQQAAQQEIQNKQEAQRIAYEGEAQKRLAEQAAEKERHQKAMEKLDTVKADNKLLVDLNKLDLNNLKQAQDAREKVYAEAVKSGETREMAAYIADQHMADLRQRMIQPQPPFAGGFNPQAGSLSGAPQQLGQPQQGQQQETGNSILDMLHRRQYHGFQAPSERPSGMSTLSPEEALKQLKQKADIEAQQKLAAKREQETRLIEQNADATKRVLNARAALSEAQKKKVDSDVEIAKKKAPLQIADLVAQTLERKARTSSIIQHIDIDKDREARLKIEAALKNNKQDATAKSDLIKLSKSQRDGVVKLNEEIMKNVATSANLDVKIAKAETDHDNATKTSAIGLKSALSAQLTDLTNKYKEANAEYLSTQVLASENGAIIPTTPSGKRDTKAEDANMKALQTQADRARRAAGHPLPPMPVVPPGTHIGALATKPQAPKKKIEKKRGKVVYSSGGVTIREK